ncbi:hypothetical protein Ancab_008628 [Ancistrocladus abbreviatus]
MVAPNRNAEDVIVRGGFDDSNRTVDSPERLMEEQTVNELTEQCQVQAAKMCRRQVRQKNLEDILNNSLCPSKKGKRIKSKSRNEGMLLPQSEESLKLEVKDSQILNMNRLHCNTCPPSQLEQHLTPRQIWDFVEQIGVRDKNNLEDVVRRIGDMK